MRPIAECIHGDASPCSPLEAPNSSDPESTTGVPVQSGSTVEADRTSWARGRVHPAVASVLLTRVLGPFRAYEALDKNAQILNTVNTIQSP